MEIAETEEMEIEDQTPTPSRSNFKRFGLKNAIQTNFGEDYVFEIVAKDDWTSIAVSLSTNAVKLYSPQTGQYLGECKGHSSTINQISFAGPSSPHVLYSCSSDSTIRAWDSRSFQQVACINSGPSEEVFSFSFGGADGNLIAAGCKAQIPFWDWRTMKQTACLEESHMEDVTQVHFVPGHQNKLVSASVDGLMCLFDTSGEINDDDHLVSVFNVGTSIGKVGFCGEASNKLWCLTHIETLSVWDWNESRTEATFDDARALASKSWTLDHVDYFVDCHYSPEEDRLWAIGGTNAGTFGYFPVNFGSTKTIGSAEAVFQGGHTDIVRTVLPMSSIPGKSTSRGIFGWTGGEDGRLCCWLSDESTETNCSWIWATVSGIDEKKAPGVDYQSNLSYYGSAANTLCISSSGEQLASGADGGELLLWKLYVTDAGEVWRVHKSFVFKDVLDLQWSADGAYLISGSVDNSCIIWDANKGSIHQILDAHFHYVQGVAWDPLGKYAVSFSSDRTCRIYVNKPSKDKGVERSNHVCQHVISKAELAVADESKSARTRSHLFLDETLPYFFRRLAWSADGSFLDVPAGFHKITPTSEPVNTAYVFSRKDISRPALMLPGATKPIVAVRFCPMKFEWLGTNTSSLFKLPYPLILAGDTESIQPIVIVAGVHYAAITDIAWSPSGNYLVLSSQDGYCTLLEFENQELGSPLSISEKKQVPGDENKSPVVKALGG